MNREKWEEYNFHTKIASDKDAPSYLREYSLREALKIDSRYVQEQIKLEFLNRLLSENQGNTKFTTLIQKQIEWRVQKKLNSVKIEKKTTAKKPSKRASKKQEKPIKQEVRESDEQIIAKILVRLRRDSKKWGRWGGKFPESDLIKLQAFKDIQDFGFYTHRGLITDHLLIPHRRDPNNQRLRIDIRDVAKWKEQNEPILNSFCAETEDIKMARQRFRVITNRLNIQDRYLLKDLAFKIETSQGNFTLRYDYVGLKTTELGIKGSWIISIFGLDPDFKQTMLDFKWVTLRSFLRNSKIPNQSIDSNLLDSTVVIEAETDEQAQKEIGYFLEEILVFIQELSIKNFQLVEKKYSDAQLQKRTWHVISLNKRTQWIIKNPRGPNINNCIYCGHALSVSISVDRAIGPVCWEKLSREKEIKRIDLRPDYNPLRYEGTISAEEFLAILVNTFSSLK